MALWSRRIDTGDNPFPSASEKRSYFGLRGRYRLEWVTEQFVPHLEDGDRALPEFREEYIGNALSRNKIVVVGVIGWLLLGFLFWKVGVVQLREGRSYLLAAENNRTRMYAQPAARGILYDRNGVPLVENVSTFSIAISPRDIIPYPDRRARLQRLLGIDDAAATELFGSARLSGRDALIVKDSVTYEEAVRIQAAVADIPGIYVQSTFTRKYLLEEAQSLSHILGYTGKMNSQEWQQILDQGTTRIDRAYSPTDRIGKSGVEKTYEHLLRGVYGKVLTEVNAQGRPGKQVSAVESIPGTGVFLTIDLAIQRQLEAAMNRAMKAMGKTRAAGVALDPRSGAVLGLVSLPAYNNNDFSTGISSAAYGALLADENMPLFNRAISGRFPSGSVIKPFIAAAALQEGLITKTTTFLSTGGLHISRWYFKDWRAGGHGVTDVRKAIADSVNTFFYIIGGGYENNEGLGVERIAAYLQQFGFGSKTGIDIQGEFAGFIPSPQWKREAKNERWYIGDTYNLSIGQGDLLVTPLQMAVATAAIANGGTLLRPHLLYALGGSTGETRVVEKPIVLNSSIIDPTHLQTIREGMRMTVTSGSGYRLQSARIPVAGKTGTAQWSQQHAPHAWFTGFAPYESPRIVVAILVEEGEEGATIASMIAAEFLTWWGTYDS
jgi:penicillin-binding protein 2